MHSDKPLNREQRSKCYHQRDLYLSCVEQHADQAIVKDADKKNTFQSPTPCTELLQNTLSSCPESWVIHFQLQWGNERLKRLLFENTNSTDTDNNNNKK